MKVVVVGSKGKTGSKVYEVLKENGYDVIGIDKDDIGLDSIIKDIDLLIDFTNKENAIKDINLCIKHQKDFICACTGFNSDELAKIKARCNQSNVKGVICYNFAIPINYLLKEFDFFSKYYNDISYLDIHHVSKIEKTSGTTYLFMLKNNKIKIKSHKSKENTITYFVQMSSKYDKMIISYQVNDRKVFALGLLSYLKGENEIINLIE